MNTDQETTKPKVQWLEITQDNCGQRIDNFLMTKLKGVPKTRIYRMIRKGEVRINKGRINNTYRLKEKDVIRIPPVRVAIRNKLINLQPTLKYTLERDFLFEDEYLMVINKPTGFAVHGGSGISSGVIEALRILRPETSFLELAHRIDKDTSGCLIIAKKRVVLKKLHDYFRGDGVKKTYLALLSGQWNKKKLLVTAPLLKSSGKGGERIVKIHPSGKFAETSFRRLNKSKDYTLVEASPITGRTHQIRVHAAWLGHPIVGDNRYGDIESNNIAKKKGCKRMFLHAERLQFSHPVTGDKLNIQAPLSSELSVFIKKYAE